jgi:hypothetical protein
MPNPQCGFHLARNTTVQAYQENYRKFPAPDDGCDTLARLEYHKK